MKMRPLSIGSAHLIERPIIQAPVGSLASARLVSAVFEAGGLGSLALTWCNADAAGIC